MSQLFMRIDRIQKLKRCASHFLRNSKLVQKIILCVKYVILFANKKKRTQADVYNSRQKSRISKCYFRKSKYDSWKTAYSESCVLNMD